MDTGPLPLAEHDNRGIVFIDSFPKNMNVTQLREYMSVFGSVERIYLVPAYSTKSRSKGNRTHRKYTSGWVEFETKKAARLAAEVLNGSPIGTGSVLDRDQAWNIKYIRGLKWYHMWEDKMNMKYSRNSKLEAQMSSVRRQNNHYLHMVEVRKRRFARQNRKRDAGNFRNSGC